MIRVVPDVNVIISAIFWRGNPYRIISSGIAGKYQLVTSPEIIDETIDKLRNKFKFPDDKIQELVDLIFTYFEIIETVTKLEVVRDPKDNKIIECALDAKADFVVSGDDDLTVLENYKGIKIIHPKEFVGLLKLD